LSVGYELAPTPWGAATECNELHHRHRADRDRASPVGRPSADHAFGLLAVVLVALAGLEYLKGFPTAGNDLLLVLILIITGGVFGAVSGTTTRVWDQQGAVWCKTGVIAGSVWVLGMGFRMGFDTPWRRNVRLSLLDSSLDHSRPGVHDGVRADGFRAGSFAWGLQYRRLRLARGAADAGMTRTSP
jgi:hypothetical protein